MKPQASLRIRADSPGPSLYEYTRCESVCESDQINKLSLSHSCACMIVTRLSVKAQASLRIGTDSPGPTVYAYTKCSSIRRPDKNEKSSSISKLRMPVCVEGISECSDELARWHRLARAFTLCIHQV